MSLNSTPTAERLHISFFGLRNAGKSSLVNAVTGQELSVVSDVKGTTTDPVSKAMELLPIGPVSICDTAGLNDTTELGKARLEKTYEVLRKTDIAVVVVDGATSSSSHADIKPRSIVAIKPATIRKASTRTKILVPLLCDDVGLF